jgi:hypothetical protein
MIDTESYRQHAADCLRQAQDQHSADDRTLVLNVALAWLRLARQTELLEIESPSSSDAAEEPEAEADERADEERDLVM